MKSQVVLRIALRKAVFMLRIETSLGMIPVSKKALLIFTDVTIPKKVLLTEESLRTMLPTVTKSERLYMTTHTMKDST